ncbi:MAG TPA: carbonic anhydrase [Ramlibacter sp.]|nr:carbonic anhydrase [Ramlibacter sp.]
MKPDDEPGDELLRRLRRFHSDYFPRHQQRFQDLVEKGQHPKTLFIGCSDSRLVPYLLTGAGPGELFIVRNVGAFIPPYDGYVTGPPHGAAGTCPPEGRAHLEAAARLADLHGTMAAIEFAVLSLKVERIVVCGHSHCGAIRAAYEGVPDEAVALKAWLKLASEALLPVQPCDEAFRRTEQRAVVLQLERLMDYPMVRSRVEQGQLTLHGWYYVIEDGEVHVFDAQQGDFVASSVASNSGTGPYQPYVEHDGQVICD